MGPRPEVRHYVNYWTPEQMHVLDVRPGITDPASIKFRSENELMEKAEDPEDYYIHVIMQEKIKLYLEYVKNSSFWYDIKLIFQTFKVIVTERWEDYFMPFGNSANIYLFQERRITYQMINDYGIW